MAQPVEAPRITVEQAAIHAARQYVHMNGYRIDDKRAAAMFLVGMAVAAMSSPRAQQEFLSGYLEQLPDAAVAIASWARFIDRALGVVDG